MSEGTERRGDAPSAQLSEARVAAMTAGGWWPDRTIVDFMADAVARHPDRNVIIDHNSATGASTALTYAELDRVSLRIAHRLRALGVGPGDVVAIQLPNWWQFAAIHLACARIGAVTNPLQPIFREHELTFMLGFASARVLFVPQRHRGFDHLAMALGMRPELPALEHVFAVGGEGEHGFEAQFLAHPWEDEATPLAPLGPNDVAEICYTSGTTGQPKGVMHTYNTLVACTGCIANQGLDAETVVLMASPLTHQTGFLYGVLLPIHLGARVVYQDLWDADVALRLIAEEGVTFTMGATPFLADLAASRVLDTHPPDSLELFVCAGAPIPRVLAETAAARLGARIAAGWGMSENGLVTLTQPDDAPEKVFGTDGVCWSGQEVRVVDDAGRVLPHGRPGRLQTRGASNFVGYLKRPEAYDVDADGWFETGDIATQDTDGYIRITGRAKDIIIRGGENVPVVEIEELLYRHPAIVDAAVVGIPDERLGERGCAFVTLVDGATLTLDALREYFEAERLAKNYWPERLEVIDAFPRTPSGKIQKYQLRERWG